MKKLMGLLAMMFVLVISNENVLATPLTASVIQQVGSWCGQPTGALSTSVYGGLPPYNYQWSNGSIYSSISGLSQGTYTVTVTDAAGTSVSASGVVDFIQEPPFYCLSVLMAAKGLNNGVAEVALYGDPYGNAPYIPSGQVSIMLWNLGTGQTIETHTEMC
ncbi:MAG TPA: hypothetical protein PLG57_01290, partial [Bacteroidia bacterium]|nr:hypothetical protein [Bacteroidia bacterium]